MLGLSLFELGLEGAIKFRISCVDVFLFLIDVIQALNDGVKMGRDGLLIGIYIFLLFLLIEKLLGSI